MSLHGVSMRQGSLVCAHMWRHLHFDLGSELFDRLLIGVLVLHEVGDASTQTAVVRIVCNSYRQKGEQ
jgi:hypothetical protein